MHDPAASTPRLEIFPPDITVHRKGNTGVEYVTTFDSGKPGPHVVVNALTHGNELCGAYALDFLFKTEVRPVAGRLTLSFANVAAFDRFDPADPFASRYVDEDFNRLWSDKVLGGSRDSVELRRARALAPLVREADLLLDIHSMHLGSPPLLMCGMRDKSILLGRRMGYPAHMVRDWGHTSGRRLRDFGAFDDPAGPKVALLIECGRHWDRSSVDVAIETAVRFLGHSGVVGREFTERHGKAGGNPAQSLIDVGPLEDGHKHALFVAQLHLRMDSFNDTLDHLIGECVEPNGDIHPLIRERNVLFRDIHFHILRHFERFLHLPDYSIAQNHHRISISVRHIESNHRVIEHLLHRPRRQCKHFIVAVTAALNCLEVVGL